MARITRKQQKIFAKNASNNGVFGSLQSNNPQTSSDPDAIQGRPAFENGWNDATYSAEELPPLEEFQALQYLFSRQIAYNFQEGIAEWNSSTTYYKGSIVKSISNAVVRVYSSLINNNTNNLVSDTSKWKLLFDSTVGYADSSLSNLTDDGKNVAKWSINISNCIKNISQDIKLELSDGTLTLKSGSVLTGVDGTQVVTSSDTTISSPAGDGTRVIFVAEDLSSVSSASIDKVVSGSTDSLSGTTYHVWYDTTNNLIKKYGSSSTQSTNQLLPIAIVKHSGGSWSSIDKVFNGAGYIGHHAFVLPGISFLRAEGKNIDGTLASTRYTRSPLSIIELNNNNRCIAINSSTGIELLEDYISVKTYNDLITDYSAVGRTLQYVIDDNMAYRMAADSPHAFAATRRTLLVRYSYDGTSVTQFDVEPVIRLDDKASIGGNNDFLGTNTVPTPATTDNSKQIANTAWVKAVSNSLMMPDYSAGVSKTHGTTYQAETNLLFCYSCNTAEYDISSIEVSSDRTNWVKVGVHKTVGGGGNDAENVGQIFVPKDWYYRANGGGSYLCVAFPLIGG